jgi:hypothetical protein
MEHDLNAKKHGYSAQSYIKALTKGLLPHWKCSQLFMQDGAGIHHACIVQSFFKLNHITTLDWPPYLPDLNPVDVGYQGAVRSLIPVQLEGLRANAAKSTTGG